MPTDIPRRIRLDQFFPQEKLIYDAMQEIEKMPPDVRLTEAGNLLNQVREKVADFIESEEGKLWRMKNTKSV